MEEQESYVQKNNPQNMKTYNFKINGKDYSVTINGIEGGNADVTVNGNPYIVELGNEIPAAAPSSPAVPVQPQAPAPAAVTEPAAAAPAGAGTVIHSPLPGVVISIDVKEGQAVKKGQKVAVLEAMKMENEIQAEVDGTVSAILVQKGDSVLEGADIIKLS